MDFSTKTIADPPKEEAVSANGTTVDAKDGTGKLGGMKPRRKMRTMSLQPTRPPVMPHSRDKIPPRRNILADHSTRRKALRSSSDAPTPTEIFGHKREFADGVELRVGQPVSFVYEVTEKGGTAKKVLVIYSELDLS